VSAFVTAVDSQLKATSEIEEKGSFQIIISRLGIHIIKRIKITRGTDIYHTGFKRSSFYSTQVVAAWLETVLEGTAQ
jgi:hypothetical protein